MPPLKLLLFILLWPGVLAAGGSLATGSCLSHLPSPLFIDGSTKTLKELADKKFTVIHLWEMNQAALIEFSRVANIAAGNRDDVRFIGAGIGDAAKLQRFPGAARLGFPVNADKGALKAMLCRPEDTLPLTVLLDRSGTILWRGKLNNLPAVLTRCRQGKFDLKEEIRLEAFKNRVKTALADNDNEKALALLAAEYQKHPEKFSLLKQQLDLLKKLNRISEALTLLHQAQAKFPANYRIFELEYILLGEKNTGLLPDFFTRLKKNFAKNPEILIAFATAECQLPPDKLELKTVLDLAQAGWQSQAFSSPAARAAYALDYARILHSIGRNDLAVQLAQTACDDLADAPKQLPKAQAALTYYKKMTAIAPTVTLPDLKK